MKTTLEIPDAIFRRAKSVAAERGIPLRELVTVRPRSGRGWALLKMAPKGADATIRRPFYPNLYSRVTFPSEAGVT